MSRGKGRAGKGRGSRDEGGDPAFEPITFAFGWSGISFLFFVSTLPMPKILRLLPLRPPEGWMWPAWMVFATGVASFAGMATGAIGWWRVGGRGARWAFFLNAVVFALVLLTVLAFSWIRFRR